MMNASNSNARWLWIVLGVALLHLTLGAWWLWKHRPQPDVVSIVQVQVQAPSLPRQEHDSARSVTEFAHSNPDAMTATSTQTVPISPTHNTLDSISPTPSKNTAHRAHRDLQNAPENSVDHSLPHNPPAASSTSVVANHSIPSIAPSAPTIDCTATVKGDSDNAGMDVRVWVMRSAATQGAQWMGLVNSMGEGRNYLREIQSAIPRIRFAHSAPECAGKKVAVTVRVLF